SKIEQKQLNTWVSFQSAEQPLLGQFSVSGNRMIAAMTRSIPESGLCSVEVMSLPRRNRLGLTVVAQIDGSLH
ncbi:hypothetical protein ACRCP3_28665, partial [Pseudomonas aeruginosa]